MGTRLSREDLVLAVLSTSHGAAWTPVQIQKMFFLLDRKIPQQLAGPHWSFQAYDYGPFDSQVYGAIEELQRTGRTAVERPTGGMRTFRLTPEGQAVGERILRGLPPPTQTYIDRLSSWLRNLSFQQLVSAVYKEYPEMRENSIFTG